jgi:hypothetical protein
MTNDRDRHPVVAAVLAEPGNAPCTCRCAVRHPDRRGVCVDTLHGRGVRVRLNAPDEKGFPICRPCAVAWPDITWPPSTSARRENLARPVERPQ